MTETGTGGWNAPPVNTAGRCRTTPRRLGDDGPAAGLRLTVKREPYGRPREPLHPFRLAIQSSTKKVRQPP
jgi:hypothetical protein